MAARVAVVFALCLASGVHAGSKPVAINRDVAVTKTLTADTLSAAALNVTGSVSVGKDVTATRVKAALLTADVLETGTLSPKAGDTIIIEGDLELASASSSSSAVSFLEAQEFIVGGNKQWRLVHHDAFSGGKTEGWDVHETSTCGTSNVFLGGHCNQATASKGAEKVFAGLPKHTEVRVKARFHFLDKWDSGDTAFAKVDDDYVWVDTPGSNSGKINICGSSHPEAALSQLMDIVLSHSADSLTLNFGAMMTRKDACKQSWGVDDVEISVK
jgi:hypothetical protein